MTVANMNCEAFDAALPDYLEGTLEGSARAQVESHLRECVRCTSLARDIEGIRDGAAALPEMVPSRDLWQGIEARIAAPVFAISAKPGRTRRLSPAWMGIAAAALIMSTAGVTYTLTARSFRAQPSTVASGPAVSLNAQNGNGAAIPESQSSGSPAIETSGNTKAAGQPEAATSGRQVIDPTGPSSGIAARMASQTSPAATPHSESIYGKEIEMLQRVVSERKAQLDPSTVAIIEKNLTIIDAAIEQSRAALAKDPASMLLTQQLSHALDKKVELLRRAALLPAST